MARVNLSITANDDDNDVYLGRCFVFISILSFHIHNKNNLIININKIIHYS